MGPDLGANVGATGRGVNAVPTTTRQHWKTAVLAPLHGAPETVRAQMVQQITREALKHGIVLRGDQGASVDYSLHGYLLVETVKSRAKVVYVWDLIDKRGIRVNRVAGEEVVAASSSTGDRWANVTPAVLAMIADKAVTCLGTTVAGTPVGDRPTALGGAAPG